jgi:hypothetical protein
MKPWRSLGVAAAHALCVLATVLSFHAARAQAPLEASVKAAYVYRFIEYVSWPAEVFKTPADPIVIGVAADDDVAEELRRIARDRRVHDRRLVVVNVAQETATPVQVLYAGARAASRVLKATFGRPVLVVTDAPDGLDRGATIALVESEGRIKFEVSLDAAHRAGISISARLLAIAVRVKKGEYRAPSYALARRLR